MPNTQVTMKWGTKSDLDLKPIENGNVYFVTDSKAVYIDKDNVRYPMSGVTSIKGDAENLYRVGDINITKTDIGLGNVDNTADVDKSVLSAVYDDESNNIAETYIKNISNSGSVFTATRGDNTTFTFSSPQGSDQNVAQTLDTSNSTYPILFGNATTADTTTSIINGVKRNNTIYLNPSTGEITAVNFAGNINGHSVNADVPSGAVFTDTTYTGTADQITLTDTAFGLAASGAAAGSYGPSTAVTGSNGTTVNIPYITVDQYGRITSISNTVYTAQNTTIPLEWTDL